ncbi:hypothetical protein ACFSUE_21375 [Sporolactobacillus shoreicorticis]|uniref:Uncharacterized protein n=1 Tax=Sporolactobacillus shoreicorticis TaxID=1923877 RepID=A0ABW5SBT8_9BACL
MKESKIAVDYLQYGDVCKRSRSATVLSADAEIEKFEKDLLASMEEEMKKESKEETAVHETC